MRNPFSFIRGRVLLSSATISLTLILIAACSSIKPLPAENIQLRTIGIPVRSVNWVRLHEGVGKNASPEIFATMGQNADNLFVLSIDPETGRLKQHLSSVPESNYPTATFMNSDGHLYIGAAYAGHLLCYDPAAERLEDMGAISPGKASFPCAIDEDDNGVLWIGSYGACDLTSFDPDTRKFTRHGRMDETDMYNYPMVNADGTVCCKIMMTRPHLVVFDPKTGRKEAVGPIAEKNKDSFTLRKGIDRRVYIISSLGNYRIEGFEAIPVDSVPEPLKKQSPSGMSFSFSDAGRQLYKELEVKNGSASPKRFALDYDAAGNDIFYIHHGPDGNIYGSSILPLHLFRYIPASGEMIDLGKCSASAGEAYSMANLDSTIYISSYPAARMSAYNPFRQYRYGSKAQDNPRELGRVDDLSYRPRSTLAGPIGKIWLASIPDYGVWSGPLSCYDPESGEKKAYYKVAGDGSCYTLAHLPEQGLIAVGTTIYGGSGAQPKIDKASLFLWDYEQEKKVWEGAPDRPVTTVNALCAAPDGKLYGTLLGGEKPVFFAFDPETRVFDYLLEIPHGNPLDLGLQVGPDGMLYGFTSSCLYRFDLKKQVIDIIYQEDNAFDVAGPIVGKDIYFAQEYVLKAMRIFR